MAQDAIKYKVVAIGGSAGSLDTILKIIGGIFLSNEFFFIVIVHRKNDNDSILTNVIAARTNFKVKEVEDKDNILPGYVYLAPPDYHLLLENKNCFSLDSSEKVFSSRPSIDVTFESVAEIFSASAIGILLSGANADGAQGLSTLKKSGAFTIVQDPKSAEVDYMPRQALEQLEPDAIIAADNIPAFLSNLLSSSYNN